MTILVTGAGGFIGSHVTERLLAQGFDVKALVRYNSRASRGFLSEIAGTERGRLTVVAGDVTDPFLVRDLVAGCDVVLHLAALIGIPYSYVAPASYVSVNVNGTLNVLEACRAARVSRVVVTSTSEVYGSARYTPIDEQHPLQGQSPYSASKIAADKLAEAYARSFDLPVVTLRPFNTYGPRQSARAIIPTLLTQALRGADPIELGNADTTRDFTYVTDTARAFVLAATRDGIDGEVIHIGQGSAIRIGNLATRCVALTGSRASLRSVPGRVRPARSEVDVLMCDPSKAARLLGWRPEVFLDDGLRRTADYLREHLGDYRATEYVL